MKGILILLCVFLTTACSESIDIPSDYSLEEKRKVSIQADIGSLTKKATPLESEEAIVHTLNKGGLDIFHIDLPANQAMLIKVTDNNASTVEDYDIALNIFDTADIDLRTTSSETVGGRVSEQNKRSSLSFMGAIQVPTGSKGAELGLVVSDAIYKHTEQEEKSSISEIFIPAQSTEQSLYLTSSLVSTSNINSANVRVEMMPVNLELEADHVVSFNAQTSSFASEGIPVGTAPLLIKVNTLKDITLTSLRYALSTYVYDNNYDYIEQTVDELFDFTLYEGLSNKAVKLTDLDLTDYFSDITPGKSDAFYLQVSPKAANTEQYILEFDIDLLSEEYGTPYNTAFSFVGDLLYDKLEYPLFSPQNTEYQFDVYAPWFTNNEFNYQSLARLNSEQGLIFEEQLSELPFSRKFTVENNSLPLLLSFDSSAAVASFGDPQSHGLENWPNFYMGIKPVQPKLNKDSTKTSYHQLPGQALSPVDIELQDDVNELVIKIGISRELIQETPIYDFKSTPVIIGDATVTINLIAPDSSVVTTSEIILEGYNDGSSSYEEHLHFDSSNLSGEGTYSLQLTVNPDNSEELTIFKYEAEIDINPEPIL